MAMSKIDQINSGLARYYANMGVKNYNDTFKEWCNDNDFDEADVAEELNNDPLDCTIVEFDDAFPLPIHDNQSDDEITRSIHEIIKNCFDHADAYMADQKTTTAIAKLYDPQSFVISQTDQEHYQKLYARQCPSMYNSGTKEDKSFFSALIVGKRHELEYVQHLFDAFMRDSVKAYKKNGTVLQPETWAKDYAYFKKVPDEHIVTLATAATKSFGTRICPRLLFNCTTKIQDSLEATTKYICESIQLVRKLAQEKEATCPFQVDVCIAFPKTKNVQTMIGVNPDDDDDDDDDNDDIYNDKEEKESASYDRIGDIVKKLKYNKLHYESTHQYTTKPTRVIGTLFDTFKHEMGKTSKTYPMKKRFVTIIDRREEKEEEEDRDTLIMYEPPENVRNIPNDAVPEWYLNASKTCILPNTGYDPETVGKETSKSNEEGNDFNINSCSSCGGALLTLSFHVKQTDQIKCYLYLNGQICRFFADDIVDILPSFFDMEYDSNQQFLDDADGTLKSQVDEVRDYLLDIQYSSVRRVWEGKN